MTTWLVLGTAVLLALLGLSERVFASSRNRTLAGLLAPLMLILFAALTAIAGGRPFAWQSSLALAGLCALLLVMRSAAAERLLAWLASPAWQRTALISAGFALILWGGALPVPPSSKDDELDWRRLAQQAMAHLRPARAAVARTDHGREIELLAMPPHALPPDALAAMEKEMAKEWGLAMRIIRTSPPDARADCHGWTFADGRWWILGADVEIILQDNGYQLVSDPRPGDLVVYRQAPTVITHTGVVVAAEDSVPLVESKWCWLGTYLHSVEDHPYGGRPSYYRSSRAGHRLTIISK